MLWPAKSCHLFLQQLHLSFDPGSSTRIVHIFDSCVHHVVVHMLLLLTSRMMVLLAG